jgi:hypothetical protein
MLKNTYLKGGFSAAPPSPGICIEVFAQLELSPRLNQLSPDLWPKEQHQDRPL